MRITAFPPGLEGDRSSFWVVTLNPPVSAWNWIQLAAGARPTNTSLFGLQVKQDSVADHMAVVAAGSELLGSVHRKLGETIEPEIRSQLDRIGPFHVHVGHVVGLVEKNAGLSPGALFIAPVRVFGGNHGIDVGAYLRIAQEVNRILRL